MRIGPQLYGFRGFDLNPAAQKSDMRTVNVRVAADSPRATQSATTQNLNALNMAKLRDLVSNIRALVSKPKNQTTPRIASTLARTSDQESPNSLQSTTKNRPPETEPKTIQETSTYEVNRTIITGNNQPQLANFQLQQYNLQPVTIQGSITRAAGNAELTITGTNEALVTENATYQLTTERGQFNLAIYSGESLQTAAARISSAATSTGVRADVQGNKLVLKSESATSQARISLLRLDISPTIVSDLNTQQITSLQVQDQSIGTAETLTGSILSQASTAELVYQGAANQTVAGSATFRLTGDLGSTLVTVTKAENLSAVATRLNQQTAATGVVVTQDGDRLRFQSVNLGASSSVRIDQVTPTATISSLGINPTQVASFTVNTLNRGSEELISGLVTQTAGKATLTLQGSASAKVISTATFLVQGALGNATITINEDENLSAAVTRINNTTNTTGVTARVNNNQIVFESTAVGSAAQINVTLQALPFDTTVTGRNNAQLTSFTAQSFTAATTKIFTGSVTQAADDATLSHNGSLGFVNANSTFTLTGNLGSAQFTTTTFQSLSNLATAVNNKTSTTGVVAAVSGNTISFRSSAVGSAAKVQVTVSSGSFSITGADGTGTAYGKDAKATVNGQSLTGTANNFSFSDNKGSYQFTTVQGYLGTISPITVTGSTEYFTLQGGNGAGTANGTDATAVINGVSRTGTGNHFGIATANGNFSLAFAAGFTGAFAPITAKSTLDEFRLSGGDNAGTDTGTDFIATVNGETYQGTSNTVSHEGTFGTYTVVFNPSSLGAYDPITISTSAGPVIGGGDGLGNAVGHDAEATLNGTNLVAQGSTFQYNTPAAQISFAAEAAFVGTLDQIQIVNEVELVQELITRQAPSTIRRPVVNEISSDLDLSDSSITNAAQSAPQKLTDEEELDFILQQIDEITDQQTANFQYSERIETDSEVALDYGSAINLKNRREVTSLTRAKTIGNIYRSLSQNAFLRTNPTIQQMLHTNFSIYQSSLDYNG